MSDPTSSSAPEGHAGRAAGALSPELIDTVLGDFRVWLQESAPLPSAGNEPAFALDWSSVLQQWIALRQEVNLQTRASRAQLEQNAQALEQLAQTVESLRRLPTAPASPPSDDRASALLKTLLDVFDALALGRREAQRLQAVLAEGLNPPPAPSLPPPPAIALPAWARWLGLDATIERGLAPWRRDVEQRLAGALRVPTWAEEELLRLQQKLDAVLVGYQMSVQRLERALGQHGLEPIDCVGGPFDPEAMEAVEVVRDGTRTGSEVLEEVRRGYRWNGRVFRYAQVRVAVPA